MLACKGDERAGPTLASLVLASSVRLVAFRLWLTVRFVNAQDDRAQKAVEAAEQVLR
jgi:hypothetical protein